ncbi:PAS domain-containing protein [Methylobacterium oryzae CBMB20]
MGVDVRTKRRGGSSVARALAVSDVGTWTWDIADDVLRCDAVAAAMLGLPRAKGDRGTTFAEFLKRIHPDDQRRIGSIIDDLRRQGGLYIAQYRTVPAPGEIRWVLARGRYIRNAEGSVSEAHGIVIDVTECGRDGFLDEAAFCATDVAAGGIDRNRRDGAGPVHRGRGRPAASRFRAPEAAARRAAARDRPATRARAGHAGSRQRPLSRAAPARSAAPCLVVANPDMAAPSRDA